VKGRILLVEPDASIRESLQRVLAIDGYDVAEAGSCRVAIESGQAVRPDAVVVAARLPDGSALDAIPLVKQIDPAIPCIVLARHEELEIGAQAIQEGAEQFLPKPVQIAAFLLVVDRVLENERNRRRRLRDEARRSRDELDPFLGGSAGVRTLADRAQRVCGANAPILIHGETGTGKGVLAAWIHRNSPRADECFLDLNCAGLSPEFLESELFGHEKGAFTGAVAAKLGLFEVAHRGTLFLDEIGDVPLPVQPKLLKVLEDKKFRRLGDVRERQVDIRLVAASHQDLLALVEKKTFRADLYFRIHTVLLEIPPLRHRSRDIPLIAEVLLARISVDLDREPMRLSPDAVRRLEAHSWPGNIRELRNVLERATLLSRGSEIGVESLGLDSCVEGRSAVSAPADRTLRENEEDTIRKTLEAERGRVARAATALGISRSSLYEKIRRYGIVVSRQ
jgi:DNA-binding NtrC family response regulator